MGVHPCMRAMRAVCNVVVNVGVGVGVGMVRGPHKDLLHLYYASTLSDGSQTWLALVCGRMLRLLAD